MKFMAGSLTSKTYIINVNLLKKVCAFIKDGEYWGSVGVPLDGKCTEPPFTNIYDYDLSLPAPTITFG